MQTFPELLEKAILFAFLLLYRIPRLTRKLGLCW